MRWTARILCIRAVRLSRLEVLGFEDWPPKIRPVLACVAALSPVQTRLVVRRAGLIPGPANGRDRDGPGTKGLKFCLLRHGAGAKSNPPPGSRTRACFADTRRGSHGRARSADGPRQPRRNRL